MQTENEKLSRTFAALADPTRRAMLERLAQGPATVKELAAPFDLSLPTISRHLQVLERAGLIERGREAQYRPAQLQTAPLEHASQWLESLDWENNLDRLEEYLRKLQENKET
ncbi:MAG: ArsR/SmtB family transcription factor [Chloroflexota bacterium]